MFEVMVSCEGVSEPAARNGIDDILEEFSTRPWEQNVRCCWHDNKLLLGATNDFDDDGKALADEFSDVVCACLPIEDKTIRFSVVSVSTIPGSDA